MRVASTGGDKPMRARSRAQPLAVLEDGIARRPCGFRAKRIAVKRPQAAAATGHPTVIGMGPPRPVGTASSP